MPYSCLRINHGHCRNLIKTAPPLLYPRYRNMSCIPIITQQKSNYVLCDQEKEIVKSYDVGKTVDLREALESPARTMTSSLSALVNTKGLEGTRGSRKDLSLSWTSTSCALAHGCYWLLGFWKLLALPVLQLGGLVWNLISTWLVLGLIRPSGYRW